MNQTKHWINAGKFIAIVAVIVNHTHNLIYKNETIEYISFFSVSLFILLSGVTSYYSCERHYANRGIKELLRRISSIFIPYVVATAAYMFINDGTINARGFLSHIIHFSASIPFYFIFFYMQLVAISMYLYDFICVLNSKKHPVILHILATITLAGMAVILMRFPLSTGIYGGGAYLFGGTYLILFYIGMVFASFRFQFRAIKSSGITAFVTSIVTLLWIILTCKNRFALDTYFPFGVGRNPPGISLMIYGVLIFALLFSLISFIELLKNKAAYKIVEAISWLGGYSLYIFLFHSAIRDVLTRLIPAAMQQRIWLMRATFMTSMVFIPVLVGYLYKSVKTAYSNAVLKAHELEK